MKKFKAPFIISNFVSIFLLLLILPGCSTNPENLKISLEYKFKTGEVLNYHMSSEATGTITVTGAGFKTSSMQYAKGTETHQCTLKLLSDINIFTENIAEQGLLADIKFMLNRIQLISEISNTKTEFLIEKGKIQKMCTYIKDTVIELPQSEKEKIEKLMAPFFEKPMCFKMSNKGRIESIELPGLAFLPQLERIFPGANFENLGLSLSEMYPIFPQSNIKVGDSWMVTTKFWIPFDQKKKELEYCISYSFLSTVSEGPYLCAVVKQTSELSVPEIKIDLNILGINTAQPPQFPLPEMFIKNLNIKTWGLNYIAIQEGKLIKKDIDNETSIETVASMSVLPTMLTVTTKLYLKGHSLLSLS